MLWFVVPYILVRLLGLALQVRIDLEREWPGDRTVTSWATLSLVGLALVLAGAFVDPPARNWIWLVAIGADLIAAGSGAAGGRTWDIRPAHFSERHGLFVIIALGESLIAAGTAVSGEPRTSALMRLVVAVLAVACLLWWSYFGWLKRATERGLAAAPADRIGSVARDAFSLGHFPLLCGIIGFAVAIEEMVRHPTTPASGRGRRRVGRRHRAVHRLVGVGVLAHVPSSCSSARLVVLVVAEGVLVLVADQDPIWPMAVFVVALLGIVIVEADAPPATTADELEIPPTDT